MTNLKLRLSIEGKEVERGYKVWRKKEGFQELKIPRTSKNRDGEREREQEQLYHFPQN